jgi:hypothetical protein
MAGRTRIPGTLRGKVGSWTLRLGAAAGVYVLLHGVGVDLPLPAVPGTRSHGPSSVLVTAASARPTGTLAPLPGAGRAPSHALVTASPGRVALHAVPARPRRSSHGSPASAPLAPAPGPTRGDSSEPAVKPTTAPAPATSRSAADESPQPNRESAPALPVQPAPPPDPPPPIETPPTPPLPVTPPSPPTLPALPLPPTPTLPVTPPLPQLVPTAQPALP